ncbi:hypothetical protein Y032_0201g1755 [Ancylostoma ceylanicum]|uniref:Uncharacterized protein n=1 Tax=Ancylostoma ceylanicum TaxID=53326 RepID=A0A016SMM1_9BILA|nr:hypothetical protein Y032_0201g1755 [Ancylostoma ceylanicum]
MRLQFQHETSYVSEQDEGVDNHTPPDIKPPLMLKLTTTNNDEEHSPVRKRGRPPRNAKAGSARNPIDPLVCPIDAAKKSLEIIFQKLSTLPPEMTQQFVPILEDLASDATDAHDKFEELKNFVPRRSLARFRNQR